MNDKYLRSLCFQNANHISRLVELNKIANNPNMINLITKRDNRNENNKEGNSNNFLNYKEFNINDLQKLTTVNKYEYMYKKLNSNKLL